MSEYLFGASELIEHLRKHSKFAFSKLPSTAIMCLSPSVAWQMAKGASWPTETALGAKWSMISKHLVMVSGFGIGAAAAAAKLEEMKVLGVRRVIFFGTVGALQSDLEPGDLLLVERAISSEGTSKHYGGGPTFMANPALLREVVQAFSKNARLRRGSIWTTDAPYRESRARLRELQNQGCLGVDMEASALLAAGAALGMAVVGALIVSDLLCDNHWQPHFGETKVREQFLRAAGNLVQAFEKRASV